MRSALISIITLLFPVAAIAGDPFPISDGPGSEPAVATLSDSSAVVVFEAGDTVVFNIPGVVFDTPLAPPGSDTESAPEVAVLRDSGFVVVWLADDGVRSRSVARIFDQTGASTSGILEVGGTGDAADVAVAGDPDGGFVVTWAEFGSMSRELVFARMLDAAGEPISPVLQASEDEDVSNIHPRVTADPEGGFTVVWGTFTPETATARARSHSGPGGNWEDAWLVAGTATFPNIGSAKGGLNYLAWTTTVGKKGLLGNWENGPVITLGGTGAGPVGVAMHPTGNGAVAWHEGGIGAPGRLRVLILDAEGQPDGEIATISEKAAGAGAPPGISVSLGGRVIFVWEDLDTGRIYGQWWAEPIVPVAENSWGSFKSMWN